MSLSARGCAPVRALFPRRRTRSGVGGRPRVYSGTHRAPLNWLALITYDGVDNGMQVVRYAFLFLHVVLGVRAPHTLLAALRHPVALLVARTLPKHARRAGWKWLMVASEAIANVRRLFLLSWWVYAILRRAAQRLWQKGSGERTPLTERLAEAGEFVASLGEACDVFAFLTGTGLFWNVLGWNEKTKWSARRRRGLERVGVFVGLAAVALQFYVQVRRSEEETTALGEARRQLQHVLENPAEKLPERDAFDTCMLHQRRLHFIAVERTSLLADASFGLFEAAYPDADKDLYESTAGLVAATLRLTKVHSEARDGELGI